MAESEEKQGANQSQEDFHSGYFSALGARFGSTDDEIAKLYKRLALKLHPGKAPAPSHSLASTRAHVHRPSTRASASASAPMHLCRPKVMAAKAAPAQPHTRPYRCALPHGAILDSDPPLQTRTRQRMQ